MFPYLHFHPSQIRTSVFRTYLFHECIFDAVCTSIFRTCVIHPPLLTFSVLAFSVLPSCGLTLIPRNYSNKRIYARFAFRILPASDDFANYNAYSEILSITFMQCPFNEYNILTKTRSLLNGMFTNFDRSVKIHFYSRWEVR